MKQEEEQQQSNHHAWLLSEIRARYPRDGGELIKAGKACGSQMYPWLLDRLTERGEEALVDEYIARRRAEQNERSWRLKRLRLAQLEEQIASRRANRQEVGLMADDSYSLHLIKTAEKLRAAIEKHDRQQQEGENNATAE